ncbi:MAG TPA: hypothetical protein VMX56_01370 [Anaerolineales bacterium]|nr:hypothetical protein [Anaerolineales bacterium]
MKLPEKGILAESIGIIGNWLKPLAGLFVLLAIFTGYLLLGREAFPSPIGE